MTPRGRRAYVPTGKDRRVVDMMAGWAIPETSVTPSSKPSWRRTAPHCPRPRQPVTHRHHIRLKSRFGWIAQQPQARERQLDKKKLGWKRHSVPSTVLPSSPLERTLF